MEGKVVRDWIFIITVLAIAFYLFFFLRSHADKCITDPITYHLKQIETRNPGTTAICSCSIIKLGAIGQILTYNSSGQVFDNHLTIPLS